MRIIRNTFSILCLIALLVSCGGNQTIKTDSSETVTVTENDQRRFDPFELSRDKEIIPVKYPQTGEITSLVFQIKDTVSSDSGSTLPLGIPESIDTLNSQVFRVQIYTSKMYGEAKKEARVAEEIFDRPVFIDYEVPYFKVRIGDFGDKENAEDYQMAVKTAGYKSAWVVLVNINIKETKPLYEDGYEEVFDDSLTNENIIGPDEN